METNLYPTIFKRKSVRRYNNQTVDVALLQEIIDQSKSMHPRVDDFEYEVEIVEGHDLKGYLNFKPPMGLVLFAQQHPMADFYAGMIMQKIDLLCSANGLGTCWLGMALPKHDSHKKLKAMATLSVGIADEPLQRDTITQFRRLDITQIRDFPYWDQVLEAVRIAPSATNGQPWYFKVQEDSIAMTFRKRIDIKDIVVSHLRWIDAGIACCHLLIALQEQKIIYTKHLNHKITNENDTICIIDISRVL
ncbi:MAG: nitroreductase family protein [Erysipelotrichaceae bacterium]|nr:nitroreductase family protein [Erysipelotrichaceae bacterium]